MPNLPRIDFTSPSFIYRLKKASPSNELLAKAIAVKKYKNIIDATAGLGKDAFLLASLGCNMRILEQNSIMASLLAGGLARAKNSGNQYIQVIANRITLYNCSAIDFLSQLNATELPDAIYLDPMFPQNNKSALVKKDMQLLAKLVGKDISNDSLLEVALTKAKHRVVVKRHKLSPLLAGKIPQCQMLGKTNRFDIYLCSS